MPCGNVQVEVCVPNAAAFREATDELAGLENVTVTRACVLAGAHECVAAYGDGLGNFCDPSLPERLSLRGGPGSSSASWRVKEAILEQYGGELPVGSAVVVTTQHAKRWLLIYAAVAPRAGSDGVVEGIAPYLAMRAVFRAVPEAVGRVSMLLPGRPVARSCAQLRRALASVSVCAPAGDDN